jgi:hypothetical protein
MQLRLAHVGQEKAANTSRRLAPLLKIGDLMWLDSRNLRTECLAEKLNLKYNGPITILEVISPHAYHLNLPSSTNINDVFHVSLLELVASNPLPDQHLPPLSPVVVDKNEEYLVEEILDSRIRRRRLKFLVKWSKYETPTLEPLSCIINSVAPD